MENDYFFEIRPYVSLSDINEELIILFIVANQYFAFKRDI